MTGSSQASSRLLLFCAVLGVVAIVSTCGFKAYFDNYSWLSAALMGAVASLLAAFPAALVLVDIRSAMTVPVAKQPVSEFHGVAHH